MARKETQRTLLPSVLDRLIDREPGNRAEPQSWRVQSAKEMKAVVRRDLIWLLNARRTPAEPSAGSKNLWRSVYCYGLPDSTGISVRSEDERTRLARAVEQAITNFEPRLTNVNVSIPTTAASSKVLHFQIEALLRTEPAPERIYFDSTLELISGEYEVEDELVRDELLVYYERELTFLRQMGADFATHYPKVASRLQLEPTRCDDPHVERMIEAVALLNARIHLRLDDDFPEITQALLNVVYPHFTRPLPSMSIAEFQMREDKVTTSLKVPRGSILYSRPVEGMPCKFQTCYDTEVWPLRITETQWTSLDRLDPPLKAPGAAAALRVRLQCWPNVKFSGLAMDKLRFYLHGEPALVHTLYELLCNNCRSIVLRDPRPRFRQRPIELIPDALRPVGFGDDEGMMAYSNRSFTPYRLLQEYFCFPEKFFFVELRGADAIRAGGFQDSVDLIFVISPFERADRQQLLELGLGPRTLRLGCAPIVNLFPHTAEPIQLDQTKYEYPVAPDHRRGRTMEVFSVDQVSCTYHETAETVTFDSFFAFRHSSREKNPTFWNATRRAAGPGGEGGTEMWLSLVDLSGRPLALHLDTLNIHCTCSNGDLPSQLPFGDEAGDFDMEQESAVDRIIAIRAPTPAVRPAVGRDALWKLVSHLSLNYLSLVEGGREALQELLRLYHGSSPHLEQQVDGISNVRSARKFARVIGDHGISYVRGMHVDLELDESKFVGGGAYLFSSVLEHFLAQYVSMNSFSQLSVRTLQRKELLKEWAPKAGNRILL